MPQLTNTAPATELSEEEAGALAPLISAPAAAARIKAGSLLLDVRGHHSRDHDGLIPGAVLADRYHLEDSLDLSQADDPDTRDRSLIVICGSVNGSGPVAAALVARGFTNVKHVAGGFPAWRAAGLPLDRAEPAGPHADTDAPAIAASPLITATDLASHSGPPLRLLDVRWSLDRPDGHADYRAGHIPGATYVDLDGELASIGDPGEGRHPLPPLDRLQQAARRWGLNDGDAVVVYDAGPGLSAARGWWLLRHAGLENVRVLDGGLAAWQAAGRPLSTEDEIPESGGVTLPGYGSARVIDADGAAAFPLIGTLLDARAAARYQGEDEPVDPRAGHIPGALSAPTAHNVGPDGRFLPPADLRARFASLGASGDHPVAVYCGSGVTASHEILALAIAGVDAALYPGSWSQWSNTPGRPVATGAEPGKPVIDA